MDWLRKYRVTIDCQNKKIYGKSPTFKKFIIHGNKKLRSASHLTLGKVRKMIQKWCTTFLAHVRDTRRKYMDSANIQIVNEYQDMFSEDLCGLPPIREVKFGFELVPKPTPISKTSY